MTITHLRSLHDIKDIQQIEHHLYFWSDSSWIPDGATVCVKDQWVNLSLHCLMSVETFPKSIFVKFTIKSWFTSTPRVATYFFSNSPVKCLLTKVVFPERILYTQDSWSNPTRFWNVILSCVCAWFKALHRISCQDLHSSWAYQCLRRPPAPA